MVEFHTSRNATEMMAFVLDCHPQAAQIRELNPGRAAVRDMPDLKYFHPDAGRERGGKAQPEGDAGLDFDPRP